MVKYVDTGPFFFLAMLSVMLLLIRLLRQSILFTISSLCLGASHRPF